MMFDIKYDIEAQDVVMKDGDFATTTNPSVQNGGILLLFRAFNVNNLILGIGVNQIRGGSVLQANYEMNRWKQQVYTDGGRANVITKTDQSGNTNFGWEANYL